MDTARQQAANEVFLAQAIRYANVADTLIILVLESGIIELEEWKNDSAGLCLRTCVWLTSKKCRGTSWGTRNERLGMVPKLLTDAKETSYWI